MTAVHGLNVNLATLGASEVVEKPFDVDDLLNKVALAVYRAREAAGTATTGTGPVPLPVLGPAPAVPALPALPRTATPGPRARPRRRSSSSSTTATGCSGSTCCCRRAATRWCR